MQIIKLLSLGLFIIIAIYTPFAIANDGWNLIPIFIGDITAVTWSGQFNLDFASYLIITALWVMWRHKFSMTGVLLGVIASVGGMLFFAPYLFFAAQRADDVRGLLLGENKP